MFSLVARHVSPTTKMVSHRRSVAPLVSPFEPFPDIAAIDTELSVE